MDEPPLPSLLHPARDSIFEKKDDGDLYSDYSFGRP
jgi:hypothetical protein